jgi:hypothetical protein
VGRQIKGNDGAEPFLQRLDERTEETGVVLPAMDKEHRRPLPQPPGGDAVDHPMLGVRQGAGHARDLAAPGPSERIDEFFGGGGFSRHWMALR